MQTVTYLAIMDVDWFDNYLAKWDGHSLQLVRNDEMSKLELLMSNLRIIRCRYKEGHRPDDS